MRLAVRLTPRGGRDAVDGWGRDAAGRPFLKVRVAAPPVEGEANAALISVLAKALKRPLSALSIVSGAGARLKAVEAAGVTQAQLDSAFGPPPPAGG
jgi:uncharacterized protein YggU (UPF0235/DUF167 family)